MIIACMKDYVNKKLKEKKLSGKKINSFSQEKHNTIYK